jgi:hypothetical protein
LGDAQVIKSTVKFLAVAATGGAVAANWRDFKRYLAITQISSSPHPERIPARGRTAYPQDPAQAQPDGTGDFDSALRGGPALHRLALR